MDGIVSWPFNGDQSVILQYRSQTSGAQVQPHGNILPISIPGRLLRRDLYLGVIELLFQPAKDMKRLGIAFESTERSHLLVQDGFAGMPKGRMAQIVSEPGELHEICVQREATLLQNLGIQLEGDRLGDLCDFKRVGKPIPEEV